MGLRHNMSHCFYRYSWGKEWRWARSSPYFEKNLISPMEIFELLSVRLEWLGAVFLLSYELSSVSSQSTVAMVCPSPQDSQHFHDNLPSSPGVSSRISCNYLLVSILLSLPPIWVKDRPFSGQHSVPVHIKTKDLGQKVKLRNRVLALCMYDA